MIHTIIIGIFTVFNCACGFYWIRRFKIDFEKTNLDRENKLHLSSPYGEVLNNGKTKQND